MGAKIGYQGFLQAWAAESALFDERSAVDDSEFSMEEAAAAFLRRILGRDPSPAEITAFVDEYVREWNTAVVYPPGVAELVVALADRFRHPAIYAEALLRLGATAENVVFAGDSYAADYLGPVAAGLTAFLIDPGEQHSIPPERRLRSLPDLAVLLGIPPRR